MANTIAGIQAEIDQLVATITPLNRDLVSWRAELKLLKAQQWIEANSVTRDRVELSDGDDRPYFMDVFEFGKWLRANSEKRFCEWNTQIHFTSEITAGRMDRNATADISELPQEKAPTP